MPDLKTIVRERVASLHLNPEAQPALAEELLEHLQDRFKELCSSGLSE